jgi:hypothetical protein
MGFGLPQDSSSAHKSRCSYPRKIRLIEDNAKCRHLKSDLERSFVASLYLSYPPPPRHNSTFVHILIHTGKGGVLNQREGESTDHKAAGSKYQHG